MKFTCDRNELLYIINTVQKSIAPKAVIKLLECMKIDITIDGDVIFYGTNRDIYIEYKADFNVTEGGSIALESRMFGEIIRRLTPGTVTFSTNPTNNITKIRNGKSEFNIQGIDAKGFPEVPEFDDSYVFKMSQSVIKNMIKKTIPFIAMNEGRKPILTGVLFDIKNETLNMVTSDGHRLAAIRKPLEKGIADRKFVVHGETLRKLLTILEDDEESMVTIKVSDRNIMFDFGDFRVYTRLLDGEFLNYNAILASSGNILVDVDKRLLTDSLERALLLVNGDTSSSSDNKVPVRFTIRDDKIDIFCVTGRGQVSDSVPAKVEGNELLIGFNCKFLLDALAGCDEDTVKIEFSSPTSGCFMRDTGGENAYVYMVLPVRLYN